ncbi:MAG: glycosyltransferase, partial [Bryobacteraceae bacterium]
MRISIVVPTKNSGPVLRRALESLLIQDVPLEIIIADGGSTDESAPILRQFEPHVTWILSGPDRNHYDAINQGFEAATGDLFGWLCADDELPAGALAAAIRAFEQHPESDVVTGACERVYADGERAIVNPPSDPWAFITRKNVMEQPATIWRAELHRRIGPLSEEFGFSADWEYWCRMR